MGELRALSQFIQELTWETLPEPVRQAAVLRVLDLVGVSMGAAKDSLVQAALSSYRQRAGNGPCSVWGTNEKLPLAEAAKVNAMMAHTLELDDVHTASKTHGSASIIPAAWACGEYLGSTGRELLLAVVCGYEVTARIGMALGVSAHRKKGWHATSTCGVFGCASAAAKLLGLPVEETLWALGMAGTQSGGLWAFLGDGASCKVLHTAHGAACGLDAAFLAQAGMTGPEHILEAEDGGLLAAMSDGGDLTRVSAGLGRDWEILNMDAKPYPCCRSAHCAVDCALELRAQARTEEIRRIAVNTYQVGYQQCAVSDGCKNPRTPLEAKFSIPYAVAAAFLAGKVTMEEFAPEQVLRDDIQELLHKVTVQEDAAFTGEYPRHWGCSMEVETVDGRICRATVRDASGSVYNPLSREQMMEKARSLIEKACPGRSREVMRSILELPEAEMLPQWQLPHLHI